MSATCHQPGHERCTDLVHAEINHLAQVIRAADPAADVPTCPGWSVRRLTEHVGQVHRWAGHIVATAAQDRVRGNAVEYEMPEDPSGLAPWLERGADALTATLRKAVPDAPNWSWGADKHARFWSRRMLHETTVHRADAEIALSRVPEITAEVSVDGVDEFLENLPHAKVFAPRVEELTGTGETIALRSPDAVWTITLTSDGFTWSHADGGTTASAGGSSRDLYLFVWGRMKADALNVSGDRDFLAWWVERSSI